MITVRVQYAKTHLSAMQVEVERGQEVVISRGDQPVARLVPFDEGHALLAGRLDWEHRDPFGRMWAAQAMIELLMLITNDPHPDGPAGSGHPLVTEGLAARPVQIGESPRFELQSGPTAWVSNPDS